MFVRFKKGAKTHAKHPKRAKTHARSLKGAMIDVLPHILLLAYMKAKKEVLLFIRPKTHVKGSIRPEIRVPLSIGIKKTHIQKSGKTETCVLVFRRTKTHVQMAIQAKKEVQAPLTTKTYVPETIGAIGRETSVKLSTRTETRVVKFIRAKTHARVDPCAGSEPKIKDTSSTGCKSKERTKEKYEPPSVEELQQMLESEETCTNTEDEVWPNVYLGDKVAAVDRDKLKIMGFTHVVNAAHGTGEISTDEEFYKCLNIQYYGVKAIDEPDFDLSPFFCPAARFIEQALLTPKGSGCVCYFLHKQAPIKLNQSIKRRAKESYGPILVCYEL
ncbi:hypothetical protein NDU88_010760 [Pleurodeles waltl]|uniref:Protein-serine/threonine phosphatase n=1 Tax=Pleurodeles waltl TaxID=8319 RepID=A0AAV7QVA6_PLEWA|nr:hypothetical protein NDU88_010760 [Pleurodeles waltl]